MAESTLNAVVAQRIEVAPGLMVLRIVPDGWELPAFQAGQFTLLGLPGGAPRCTLSDPEEKARHPEALIKRAYSIASSSVAHEYVELFITLVRSGALTPRLFALNPGDRLWLSPKTSGLFTLESVPAGNHVVLISTGTGLAPYMSMLRTHLCPTDGRRYAVLHGARHSWDLGYRSELITLARVCPAFTYLPIVSRPEEEPVTWSGTTGHVQSLWDDGALQSAWGEPPTPATTHVFLCGNPTMVDDLTTRLLAAGWTNHTKKAPGTLHVERYW